MKNNSVVTGKQRAFGQLQAALMCAALLAATKDLPEDFGLESQTNQHALSEIFGIENPRHVRI